MKFKNLIVAILVTAFISLNMVLMYSHKSVIPKKLYVSEYERLDIADYKEELDKEGFIAPKGLHTVYMKKDQKMDSWLVREGESVEVGTELASLRLEHIEAQRTQMNAELVALQNKSSSISQTISDLEYEQAISGGTRGSNDYYDSNDANSVRVNLNVDIEVVGEATFAQAIADATRDLADVQREIETVESKIAELPTESAMTSPVSGYVEKINRNQVNPSIDIYSTDQLVVTYVLDDEWPSVKTGNFVTIQHDAIRTPFIPKIPTADYEAVSNLRYQKVASVSADGATPSDIYLDDSVFDDGNKTPLVPVKLGPDEENFDGTSGNPDGSMDNPDGTVIKPDGTIGTPEKVNTDTSAPSKTKPNTPPAEANPEGTLNSDGTITHSDGSTVNLDGTITNADGSISNLDGTITNPDGSIKNPEGSVTNPDGSITNPDGTITNPDGTTTELDGVITNPDGSLNDGTPPPGAVQTQTAKERKLAEVRKRIKPDYPTEISTQSGIVVSVAKIPATEDNWLKAYKSLGNTQKNNPLTYYEVLIAPADEQLDLPFGTNVNTFIQTNEANRAASIKTDWLLNKHNDRAQIWTLDTKGHAILQTVDTPFTALDRSILTSGIEPGAIALHNDDLDTYLLDQPIFHPLPLYIPSQEKWKEVEWRDYVKHLMSR